MLVRPARIPVWARRSLTVANTAGTAGSMLMTNKAAENTGALGVKPVSGPRDTAASTGSALAAAAGSLSLLTSGIGLKLDAKAESYLTKRGVKRPRLWMAVGAIGLVFVIKTVQDAATRKAEDAATKFADSRQVPPAAGDKVRRSDIAATSKPAVTGAKPSTSTTAPTAAGSTGSSGSGASAGSAGADSTAASSASDGDKKSAEKAEKIAPATDSTTATDQARPVVSSTDGSSDQAPALAAASAADAADAPGTATPNVEDTPIWKDVAEPKGGAETIADADGQSDASDASGAAGATDETADRAAADEAGADSTDESTDASDVTSDAKAAGTPDAADNADEKADKTGGSTAYRPSRFEQQLAETTPDDVDGPLADGLQRE